MLNRPLRTGQTLMLVTAATLLLASCGESSSGDGGNDGGGGQTGAYSADEVAEATGERKVTSIYAVPKDVEDYRFAFINPAISFPFFADWSKGMNDAAEFYGVDLDEEDLDFKYENALTAYENLIVKSPDVLGGGGGNLNSATLDAAASDDIPVVSIDGAIDGGKDFGVDDATVGKMSMDLLIPPTKERTAAVWADRDVIVAGISAPNCVPCDTRIKAAFQVAEDELGIAEDDTFLIVPGSGQDPNTVAQSTVTDFLTAHPEEAVLVVSYGDDTVVAALQAAKEADRTDDVLAVASGGSEPARKALRDATNADMLVGAIDFQPYAEGWNWVEAAIATAMGDEFEAYEVDRVLTPSNVDQYYPSDPK